MCGDIVWKIVGSPVIGICALGSLGYKAMIMWAGPSFGLLVYNPCLHWCPWWSLVAVVFISCLCMSISRLQEMHIGFRVLLRDKNELPGNAMSSLVNHIPCFSWSIKYLHITKITVSHKLTLHKHWCIEKLRTWGCTCEGKESAEHVGWGGDATISCLFQQIIISFKLPGRMEGKGEIVKKA